MVLALGAELLAHPGTEVHWVATVCKASTLRQTLEYATQESALKMEF